MSIKKTIGGNRLGSGNKMEVDLKNFERSTHNMSYLWRSTMSAGTLVPFIVEPGLPGDTFDIDLNAKGLTLPTTGPLFGSYKMQLDVFVAPIRLYHRALHNNKLGIGMKMNTIKLPQLEVFVKELDYTKPLDNQHTNPSSILANLNLRGFGNVGTGNSTLRHFNAIPFLAYWDIYKNYYANKQEEIGAFINNEINIIKTVTVIKIGDGVGGETTIGGEPSTPVNVKLLINGYTSITYAGTEPNVDAIMLNVRGKYVPIGEIYSEIIHSNATTLLAKNLNTKYINEVVHSWRYLKDNELLATTPQIKTFPLENIDTVREEILSHPTTSPYIINGDSIAPFGSSLPKAGDPYNPLLASQEGLAIKTYQSDLLNNWMQTEWIDGDNGISEITAIDTSDGKFTIDTLVLSRKVYDMLNQIAISGGTYNNWIEAVYGQEPFKKAETPLYMGGLIKDIVFEEVVSNSNSITEEGAQPLGTLAGRGKMGGKHKGGSVTIKIDEPSYVIGIISLTPLIDYSQGNKWDVNLKTMDDFHKPHLDQIGFQDLITEQMAHWDTTWNDDGSDTWIQHSAGKQPAWLNYMTNVNIVRGNFAIEDNQMFMTLNRKYEHNEQTGRIKDLTTYIDPVKYNQIFAQTERDAQNFWVQIAINITARRKMSAKIMPNL